MATVILPGVGWLLFLARSLETNHRHGFRFVLHQKSPFRLVVVLPLRVVVVGLNVPDVLVVVAFCCCVGSLHIACSCG
jgi:hypothetical protein